MQRPPAQRSTVQPTPSSQSSSATQPPLDVDDVALVLVVPLVDALVVAVALVVEVVAVAPPAPASLIRTSMSERAPQAMRSDASVAREEWETQRTVPQSPRNRPESQRSRTAEAAHANRLDGRDSGHGQAGEPLP